MKVTNQGCWERFKARCCDCCSKGKSSHNRIPTRVEDLVEAAVQPSNFTVVKVESQPSKNSVMEFLKEENARMNHEKTNDDSKKQPTKIEIKV